MALLVSSFFVSLSRYLRSAPASIFCLLLHTCPSAIGRLVPFGVINSINRILSIGCWPHILQKIGKAAVPSFANRYAFASVIFVRSVFRIVASLPHIYPTAIFGGKFSISSLIVERITCSFGASATCTFTTFYGLRRNSSLYSANTNASPVNLLKLPNAVI